jgi:hypothetical protein
VIGDEPETPTTIRVRQWMLVPQGEDTSRAGVPSHGASIERPTVVGLVVKPIGKPSAGNRHARLCVQRRVACSAGGRPAGATVRSPVVRIAGWRETKILKPIDEVSLGEITSHRAVTTVNVDVASKMSGSEGRTRNRRVKAAWGAEI